MPSPWVSDATLKTLVANNLGIADDTLLPAKWTPLITQGNTEAFKFILRKLIGERGYSWDQVNTWWERNEFNTSIALFFIFSYGRELVDNTVRDRPLDRRKELDVLMLLDDNLVPINPGGTTGDDVSGGLLDWSRLPISPDSTFTFTPEMAPGPEPYGSGSGYRC